MCTARRKKAEVVPEDEFVDEEYIGEHCQCIHGHAKQQSSPLSQVGSVDEDFLGA